MIFDQNKSISIISFGEILWDVIEEHSHLGGAAYNLSAHAARLGVNARLLSSVCDDELGRRALGEARAAGVDVSNILVQSAYPTGVVKVALCNGQPEYDIQGPVAWDFIECPSSILDLKDSSAVDAICFGTLAQRSAVSRQALRTLIAHYRGVPTFYDVNFRQQFYSSDLIEWGFRHATVVKVNNTESDIIAQLLFTAPLSNKQLAQKLCKTYGVEVVLVTQGPEGCLVATSHSVEHVPGTPVSVIDTVGAGDAFSAGFICAWLRGQSFVEAACVGNQLGAYTATMRGAVPWYSNQLVTSLFAAGATR